MPGGIRTPLTIGGPYGPVDFLESRAGQPQKDTVLLVLVAVGIGLRLWQYLADPSLWVDEIFVTTNILGRPMSQLLFSPLDYGQVAPLGFLWIEKLLSLSLGPSDLALRLLPAVWSLAGLAGFAGLVGLLLDGLAARVALALFAVAPPLVAYSSQVKQYSSDVAIAVLLLWLASDLSLKGLSLRRSLLAGILGAISVWFSQTAVLMLAGLGVSLILIVWRDRTQTVRHEGRALFLLLALWTASSFVAVWASLKIMTPRIYSFMHWYWAEGFLPVPAQRAIELGWPWRQFRAVVGAGGQAGLAYPFSSFYCLLILLGLLLLWPRLGARAGLVVMPAVVTLFAAIVRQYPFADRAILFLLPTFLIAIGASVEWLCRRTASWSRPLAWLVGLALVGPALYPAAAYPPPYRIEDLKRVMAYVGANRRPGDVVYVFHGARPSFGFYSADYGFRGESYVLGGCHRGDNRLYREELDRFRGQPRVWLVLTHAIPSYHERDDIVSYLDAIGVRLGDFTAPSRTAGQAPPPAEALLYDLSDQRRLGNATANSVPLIGATSQEMRFACGDDPPVVIPPRQH